MTHPAPNSELTGESVKLLKAGDVLRHRAGHIGYLRGIGEYLEIETLSGELFPGSFDAFTFIGRSDADGWMLHDGGPNPVPGCVVETRSKFDSREGPELSDRINWLNNYDFAQITAFRLAAPSVERDQGSSLRDTHRATEDQWAVLEGLAKAATPGPWRCVSEARVHSNRSEGRHEVCFVDQQWGENRTGNAAFIAAANPATVLKLIEAARASQVGMEREARNDPDIIEQARGILADPKPDVAGAREAPTMDDRIGTHSPDCWSLGPRHYDCATRRIAELEAKLATAGEAFQPEALIDRLSTCALVVRGLRRVLVEADGVMTFVKSNADRHYGSCEGDDISHASNLIKAAIIDAEAFLGDAPKGSVAHQIEMAVARTTLNNTIIPGADQ